MEKCAVFEILVSFGKSAQGSLNPCGRGRKKTENFGRLCRQMARERREKRFFLENSGGRYSLHNPGFEGELAKIKKPTSNDRRRNCLRNWWCPRLKNSATLFEGKTYSPPVFSIFFRVTKHRPLIFFSRTEKKTCIFEHKSSEVEVCIYCFASVL